MTVNSSMVLPLGLETADRVELTQVQTATPPVQALTNYMTWLQQAKPFSACFLCVACPEFKFPACRWLFILCWGQAHLAVSNARSLPDLYVSLCRTRWSRSSRPGDSVPLSSSTKYLSLSVPDVLLSDLAQVGITYDELYETPLLLPSNSTRSYTSSRSTFSVLAPRTVLIAPERSAVCVITANVDELTESGRMRLQNSLYDRHRMVGIPLPHSLHVPSSCQLPKVSSKGSSLRSRRYSKPALRSEENCEISPKLWHLALACSLAT